MDEITEVLNQRRKDEKMGSDLTRGDIFKFIQSDEVSLRGVNLSGLDLSKLVWSNTVLFLLIMDIQIM